MGVETSVGVSDEVERVERLFSEVVSDDICWSSEEKLVGVEPAKKKDQENVLLKRSVR